MGIFIYIDFAFFFLNKDKKVRAPTGLIFSFNSQILIGYKLEATAFDYMYLIV
jgi:hypothetical protein